MKEMNLKKAAKLLPHGAIAEISFDIRISQSTVSRIIQGEKLKGADKVKSGIFKRLFLLKKDLENILSEFEEK